MKNRDLAVRGALIRLRCDRMLMRFQTRRLLNVGIILAYQRSVFGLKRIDCTRKKTLGYKERCPKQRSAYRQTLASAERCGKSLVYVDEVGFRAESFRRYAYAPRGECVLGLISSQRTRTTTLLAARIENIFTATKTRISPRKVH